MKLFTENLFFAISIFFIGIILSIIISDAMGSRNSLDHEIALQRMLQKGAIITTTESIIFEICKTSDRKEFKEIRNIIKN